MNGVLKPADALPGEVELATRFGVNRSTVREGIRQLETEGLMRRMGRKRLVVTIPALTDLAPKTTRALLMHEVKFRELWEVAYVLESLSAELAARHASDEDIAALQGNLERMSSSLLLSREPVGLLLYPAFEGLKLANPASGRTQSAGPSRDCKCHREAR